MVLRERVQTGRGAGRGDQILEVLEPSFTRPALSLTSLCGDILTCSAAGHTSRKQLSNQLHPFKCLQSLSAAADHQLSILQHSARTGSTHTLAVINRRHLLSSRTHTHTHIYTVEPFCILDIQEGGGSPDSDGAVIGGAGQQSGQDGVPAHTVDSAGVTSQLGDGQLAAPVPDVNLVV